jgi:uncharacterized protein
MIPTQVRPPTRCLLFALAMSGLALSACGHSPASHFVALQAIPAQARPDAAPAGPPVRIASVRFPAQFDRPEVVEDLASSQVMVDGVQRWSAPIGELARATLAEDLLKRAPRLNLLPEIGADSADARYVVVEILSFRRTAVGFSMLATLYVSPMHQGEAPVTRTLSLNAPSSGADAEAEAEALSRLLGEMAGALAPLLASQG